MNENVPFLSNLTQNELESAIETTIKLLRFLTKGEGYASISVFDAGAGGGFSIGELSINLERSGLLLNEKVFSPKELKQLILDASNPYPSMKEVNVNNWFLEYPWDDEE